MLILGMDPGMAIVGYSLLNTEGDTLELVSSGSIQTKSDKKDSQRLLEIFEDMCTIIEKFKHSFRKSEIVHRKLFRKISRIR